MQVALAAMKCEHSPTYLPCPRRHGSSSTWCANCTRERALRRRERELLESWYAEWTPVLRDENGGYLLSSELTVRVRCDGHSDHDLAFTFRRGFIAAVACPLAAWCGGACGRCNGGLIMGKWNTPDGYCAICRGTGRTEAHGPKLVRACPLESVRLTDKRPVKSEGVEYYAWAWPVHYQGRVSPPSAWELPREIFDHLLPDRNCVRVTDGVMVFTRGYSTEDDAHAALSAAAIAWARAQLI